MGNTIHLKIADHTNANRKDGKSEYSRIAIQRNGDRVTVTHIGGVAPILRSSLLAAILERQAKDYDEKARKCT